MSVLCKRTMKSIVVWCDKAEDIVLALRPLDSRRKRHPLGMNHAVPD